jgi:hypothetical protein
MIIVGFWLDVPLFYIFSHLMFNLIDQESVASVLYVPDLRCIQFSIKSIADHTILKGGLLLYLNFFFLVKIVGKLFIISKFKWDFL